MTEVRNLSEGYLYWVQASGSGSSWVTASAASGQLVAYCRSLSFTSGQNIVAVSDYGVPTHFKFTDKQAIQLTVGIAYGITGQFYKPASGSGATVPMGHIEYKMNAFERGASAADFYQFFGVPLSQLQFNAANPENSLSYTLMALGMNGPTASGYLGAIS